MGTTFGGAVDPVHVMMLTKTLGDRDVVWDKAASVRFERPATETLYARVELSDEELATIRGTLTDRSSIDREYAVTLVDADGIVHVTVEKAVHVSTDAGKRA